MKICYIGNGRSIHTIRWVKWFKEQGHDVHLITRKCESIEGISIHIIQIDKGFYIPRLRLIRAVKKIIKDIEPDILHAHQALGYATYGALSGFHPFVVSVWGGEVLRKTQGFFIKKLITKFIFKKADMITTTAKFLGKYLEKEYGLPKDKIKRIPWGIDLEIFHSKYREEAKKLRENLKIRDDSLVIISNRQLRPEYEIQTTVEAIPYVTEKYPDSIFIFIKSLKGYEDLDFEKSMKSRVNELGVAKNTIFLTNDISSDEMAIFLNMSDIFISIPKTDQFSASVMEGMACGPAPIVSDIDVYKQYLKDYSNALFVNPDSPKELADKIFYYAENEQLKENYHKINKKIIEEKESWDINAKKMENLYIDIIGDIT